MCISISLKWQVHGAGPKSTMVLLHLVDLLSENCSVGSEINPLELANNASQTCSPSAKCSKVLEVGRGGGVGWRPATSSFAVFFYKIHHESPDTSLSCFLECVTVFIMSVIARYQKFSHNYSFRSAPKKKANNFLGLLKAC